MATKQTRKSKKDKYTVTVQQNYIHSQYDDIFSKYLAPKKQKMNIGDCVVKLDGYDCQVLRKSTNKKKLITEQKKAKKSSLGYRHLVEDILLMRHYKDLHEDYLNDIELD